MGQGVIQIFKDFSNWSTVCGVPHIANASTKLSRFFWIFVFAAMVIMFSYELYIMIVKFLSYPAMVTTNLNFDEQRFPVITVCNFNPLKYSVVESPDNPDYSEIRLLMDTYKAAVAKNLDAPDKWGLYDVQDKPFDRDTRAQDALVLEIAKLSDAALEAGTYSFNELISECSFSSHPCTESDFTKIYNPVYGACYSFNENKELNYSCNRAGIKFGLKLLVTVSQERPDNTWDFLPTTHSAGARVAINAPGTLPALEATGINAGVGYQTAISIDTAHTNRAKKPYGSCLDREPADTDLYANYTYTLETCFNGCRQRKTNEVCGCATPRFPLGAGMAYCEPTKANLDCLQSLKGDQTNKSNPNMNAMVECDCHPPCSEDSFTSTASLARYPATSYYVAVGEKGDEGVAGSCSTTNPKFPPTPSDPDYGRKMCRDWYQGNGLLLSVFFESLVTDLYNEVPAYGIGAVINDLGGQAGLWLGLSVISVVEILGLGGLLFAWCLSGGAIKIRPSDNDLENDHRIKDIETVKRELDNYDKEDEDEEMSDDDSKKKK